MAILMPAQDFDNFAQNGLYFQLTLGRRLMETEHYHDYYELICVLSGSCIHSVNGSASRQYPGEVRLLRPGDTHCFISQERDTSLLSVSFYRSIADAFFRAYMLDGIDELAEPPVFSLTVSELLSCKRAGERVLAAEPRENPRLVRLLIGQFMSALSLRGGRDIGAADEPSETFRQALESMNELDAAAEGMPAFLRLSNFSHAQLCRLTKKYLGKTPSGIITEIRMRYAWELVSGSELDLESVGERVGYRSYSHFCALFRKIYGQPPSAVRQDAIKRLNTV